MEKELINQILSDLEKDYLVWNCYREDSVKACLYFSIKNFYLEENKQKKIFIYPEVRNIWNSAVYKKRFDLVISNKKFTNWDYTIDWFFEANKDIIEIKYIKWNEKQITDSLDNDFSKLLEVEENKIKSKNIFFIYEHYKRNEDYVKNVKKAILKIWEKEEYIEKIKNSKIKINIFWLFVDLGNSESNQNYKIDFFKSWEK